MKRKDNQNNLIGDMIEGFGQGIATMMKIGCGIIILLVIIILVLIFY